MSENSDALKRGYDAFAQGDLDTVRGLWADDIRWEGPNAPGLVGSGVFNGADEVMNMIGELQGEWSEFRVTPDEFIEGGETVVVLGHTEGTPKDGGSQVKVPFVHVWRMAGGKVNEVQTLTDTKVVADALGK
jgi:ketosteroid isomerase-like protein